MEVPCKLHFILNIIRSNTLLMSYFMLCSLCISRYERVWDPSVAEKMGKLDFVHARVQPNRREGGYLLLAQQGYRIEGLYQKVRALSPTDCSEWTKADKERFRSAVFENHEDMKAVSDVLNKPMSECITYYLVKFKKSKSYKSLKRSMKRKANMGEGNAAGTLVCNECGKGGMLIVCDTCEAHCHLACATPPLESIPDGTWNCFNCKRGTRSMMSSQDEMSASTADRNQAEESDDTSVENTGDRSSKSSGDKSASEARNGSKRKLDFEDDQGESPHHKMVKMDGDDEKKEEAGDRKVAAE